MTIVGFEIRENGSANLLVFDPMFKTSPAMERLIRAFVEPSDPTRLLKASTHQARFLSTMSLNASVEAPRTRATSALSQNIT